MLALALATTSLIAGYATAASAQLPEGVSQDTPGTVFDTENTPVAKPSALWQKLAGAPYPDPAYPDQPELRDSPTPQELDFFDVAFSDPAHGFAGGAECEQLRQDLDTCPRVPVIYRHRLEDIPNTDRQQVFWEQVFRGQGSGYVGAIAWIGAGRALAVGGTGAYPRREPAFGQDVDGGVCAPDPSEPYGAGCDQAGMARAWLYENGAWRELRNLPDGATGDEIPDAMRGMTTLACTPRPETDGEFCAAGGLGQLWQWRAGESGPGFEAEGYDMHSAEPRLEDATLFRFRVRDIRFVPESPKYTPGPGDPQAVAVTAGCCAEDALHNVPRVLVLQGGSWHARDLFADPADLIEDSSTLDDPHLPQGAPDLVDGQTAKENANTVRPLGPRRTLRDSYLSVVTGYAGNATFGMSVVVGPGGPRSDTEPASRVTTLQPIPIRKRRFDNSCRAPTPSLACVVSTPTPYTSRVFGIGGLFEEEGRSLRITSARLVSADAAGTSASLSTPIADLAVGELASSGQGVASGGISPPLEACADPIPAPPDPVPPIIACQTSRALIRLPSYALNSIDIVGIGSGWAVGDRGAILRYDNEGARIAAGIAREAEPSPPQLGAPERAAFPSAAPYDGHRPAMGTSPPGAVPSLADRPIARLPEPQLVPAGTPLPAGGVDVDSIVMSRDGSDGWAFAGGSGKLFHYDGWQWSTCDPHGVPGQLPPDPACEDLASLPGLNAVARVPLERDLNPSNDDEFELLGFGSNGVIARYRESRWQPEPLPFVDGSRSLSRNSAVAFTAPDDGWVVLQASSILDERPAIYHFDGERWVNCEKAAVAGDSKSCADAGGRLPFATAGQSSQLRLATAGERVYLYGWRLGQGGSDAVDRGATDSAVKYPLILYRDEGGEWTDGDDPATGAYDPSGGFDPGCASRDPGRACLATGRAADQGYVLSLSVNELPGGRFAGWAVGRFGVRSVSNAVRPPTAILPELGPSDVSARDHAAALRLTASGSGRETWTRWSAADAIDDYLLDLETGGYPPRLLSLAAADGDGLAVLAPPPSQLASVGSRPYPALIFNPDRQRWEAMPTPFWTVSPFSGTGAIDAKVAALAPDGSGGFWLVTSASPSFYRYSDRTPSPVFEPAPQPLRRPGWTSAATGDDGSFWLGAPGTLYRYDRVTGWERVRIPGWDPPGAVGSSQVGAIAVNASGQGVALGPGGRVADIDPGGVRLDEAAGTVCGLPVVPPCGTAKELGAAAVAPDGSAMVAGGKLALLWRPARGGFRRIAPPTAPSDTTFSSVALPRSDRAWLATTQGEVFAGELGADGAWRWQLENLDDSGGALGLDATGAPLALRSIAIDAGGHGYAVGDGGLVLERTADGDSPWRRVKMGFLNNFTDVALPAGGGPGALVGGYPGLILTLVEGRGFEVARQSYRGDLFGGAVAGLGLFPGPQPGQTEAWAALMSGGGDAELLHYASDSGEPLLSPEGRAGPLPDSPAPRPGELSFAAFGKSDCQFLSSVRRPCTELTGASFSNEVIARRVVDEILARSTRSGGPAFAVFTGDANDASGSQTDPIRGVSTPIDTSINHHRWNELIANRLQDAGLPTFAALGGQDLSQGQACSALTSGGVLVGACNNTRTVGRTQFGAQRAGVDVASGLNLPWRQAMAQMPPPWGAPSAGNEPAQRGALLFEPVGDGGSVRTEDTQVAGLDVEDPDGGGPAPGSSTPAARVPAGGASTHYALDVVDASQGDRPIARLVFVDSSLRSLQAADPLQQPLEPGGQAGWLEEVLCIGGSAADAGQCTRDPGEPAVVVSNTPTYSYAPTDPTQTAADATAFETILLRNHATAVVSGRLGWNGLYWALAPGLHYPCPGQGYPQSPPDPAHPTLCGQGLGSGSESAPSPDDAAGSVDDRAPAGRPLLDEAAGVDGSLAGPLPFVVASGAGGKFDENAEQIGQATAEQGFWHGYSIVRLSPDGDPAKTVVEQRPVLDWIGLEGEERALAPRESLTLAGYGREPVGLDDLSPFIEIPQNQAVTHRFDLLLADPEEPWLACEASDPGCQSLQTKLVGGSRSLGSARDDIGESRDGSGGAYGDDSGGASGTANDSGEASGAPTLSSRPEAARSAAAAEGSWPGNPCEPYLCLPQRVGAVDPTTGEVQAGDGKHPDIFAIAMLSVGDHVATYPLMFKKSPSFVINPLRLPLDAPGLPASAAASPQVPPPPSVPKPNVPQPSLPELPALPGIPPLAAAQPPEPQPPAPPAPPPPAQQPSPLDLTVSPQAIAIATPTAVIQPPTPPVNPAPPGGARREARQRQAAAQKSGADPTDESSRASDQTMASGGDLAQGPLSIQGSEMTRHDHAFTRHVSAETPFGSISVTDAQGIRPGQGHAWREPAFTALSRSGPSAGAQGLLYGGGITIAALALALSFTGVRPTPRRRPPEVPSPAWSRAGRGRGTTTLF